MTTTYCTRPHRREMQPALNDVALLFCDLRGFTETAERLKPARVAELLECYYATLTPIVEASRGVVVQYTGDEIFALFGSSTSSERPVDDAVNAGLDMLSSTPELNRRLGAVGLGAARLGIGVHRGEVLVRQSSCARHAGLTVFGHAINVARRICSVASAGQIIVSASVFASCSARPDATYLELEGLKGLSGPVGAYVLGSCDARDEVSAAVNDLRSAEPPKKVPTCAGSLVPDDSMLRAEVPGALAIPRRRTGASGPLRRSSRPSTCRRTGSREALSHSRRPGTRRSDGRPR